MLCKEIIALCSQIHTKHVNKLFGQNLELLKVKLSVQKLSLRLYKVKSVADNTVGYFSVFTKHSLRQNSPDCHAAAGNWCVDVRDFSVHSSSSATAVTRPLTGSMGKHNPTLKLITHFHKVSKLRISGALPPCFLYALVMWQKYFDTNLTFYFKSIFWRRSFVAICYFSTLYNNCIFSICYFKTTYTNLFFNLLFHNTL